MQKTNYKEAYVITSKNENVILELTGKCFDDDIQTPPNVKSQFMFGRVSKCK